MVVDDEPDLLLTVIRALHAAGYEAYGYTNVAAAKSANGEWGLMLVDIRLPDGDGREVLAHFQRGGIVMSGFHTPKPFSIPGISEFLRKPFTLTELLNTVRRFLPKESIT